ncbi:MAG TPA: ABC-2 family transporter protein [Drouetiella sp.]
MNKFTAVLAKYWWIAITSAKSNLAYLAEIGSRVFFLGIILYIFLRLWQVTYGETGSQTLGGFTLNQMLWYLAITESIILSGPRVAQAVDQDIRTGAISVHFIRPLSYPLYCMFNTLGERVVRFSVNLFVGAMISLVFVGFIPMTASGFLLFLAALPFAFIVDFLGNFLIGLAAFWLEDTNGLVLIYSRGTMILGGMLIPMELFPDSWQSMLKLLPFSAIVYGPARLFVQPDAQFFVETFMRQVCASIVFGIAVFAVFKIASRRVFANGG